VVSVEITQDKKWSPLPDVTTAIENIFKSVRQ
jgi:hypothetical protein